MNCSKILRAAPCRIGEIARIWSLALFHLKNKAMLEDFKSGKFGRYRGHVQVGPRFIARPRSPTDHGCR